MVYVDFTVLIQVVQFLVLLFIAKKFILDPVLGTVESRNSKIDSMQEEAAALKQKVEDQKEEYTKKMADMRAELAEHHRKMKEQAQKEASAKVSEVKEQIDAKISEARAEIEAEAEKARKDMDTMVNELSGMIVDKIVLSA